MRKSLTNGDYAEAVFIVDSAGNAASIGGGTGGAGDASAANQLTEIAKLTNIDTDIGSVGDSAATSDTGSFSLISLIKRILSTKLPNLVSNRIPVDGSGVTQPISASALPLPTGAATSANQSTSNTSLASIDGKLPSTAASQSDVQAVRDRLMPSGTVSPSIGSSVSGNLKASTGNVYAFSCSNQSTSLVWFQLFDKATAPTNGDTPIRSFPVYGTATGMPGFLLIGQDIVGGSGISFTTGVGWAISSTATTLTLTTASASNFITTVRWA